MKFVLASILLTALSYATFIWARQVHHEKGVGLAGYWYILSVAWFLKAAVFSLAAIGMLS